MTALADVKAALHVIHNADDDYLSRLITSATNEFARFTNAEVDSDGNVEMNQDAFNGIVLMVRADYEVEPDKRPALRSAAETLWMPYRTGLGA